MKNIFFLAGLLLLSGCGTNAPEAVSFESWTAELSAQKTATSSSSKLDLAWELPDEAMDHLVARATEDVGGSSVDFLIDAQESNTQLSGLKSATTYTVKLIGCVDRTCTSQLQSEMIEATTSEEVWQIQGTGHSYKTADRVVPEGSTLAYAFQYGDGAPKELEGLTRFYYNPSPGSSWRAGMRPALSEKGVFDSFTPAEDGLKLPCDIMHKDQCPQSGAYYFTATQAVPLASGGIRLFFEAMDLTPKLQTTRNFTLDSQDGYVGEDFNTDPDRVSCGGLGSSDYAPGEDCEPTVVLGVTGDAQAGDTGMKQVRQSKIGFPQLDSWLWDEAVGTFMSITGADSCGVTQDGLFYAQWDGEEWEVIKNAKGCAKPMIEKAHGPVIVHLGDARYKLYYEEITGQFNRNPGKPFRMIYGNGELTGNALTLEFEDWELESQARDVTFLWPDGTTMTADQESGLGDHFIFVPDADLDKQRMYMNLGGLDDDTPKEPSQGLGTAVLTNP